MRPGRLLIALCLALTAAGCLRARPPRPVVVAAPPPVLAAQASVPAAPARAVASDPAYRLDSGDKLRVLVFGQEGLSHSYAVDPTGAITLPLIGAVAARGRTADELARAIAARLRQGYVREPHVAVEIEAYRPFFILGEVAHPGQYPYVPRMTVETAVAIAGGFSPRADRAGVRLTRNAPGAPARATVPLAFPLQPGDTVNVQERWF